MLVSDFQPVDGAKYVIYYENLQVYPAGYFSRFPQYGTLGMDMRA